VKNSSTTSTMPRPSPAENKICERRLVQWMRCVERGGSVVMGEDERA
jgi:hypothetical protein